MGTASAWTEERCVRQAQNARRIKPWLKSTGPKSEGGKLACAYRRFNKFLDTLDLEAATRLRNADNNVRVNVATAEQEPRWVCKRRWGLGSHERLDNYIWWLNFQVQQRATEQAIAERAAEIAQAGGDQTEQTRSRSWTPERSARQAEVIRRCEPWNKSTGPKTAEGKAASSRNAYKGGCREYDRTSMKCARLIGKLLKISREVSGVHPITGAPAKPRKRQMRLRTLLVMNERAKAIESELSALMRSLNGYVATIG